MQLLGSYVNLGLGGGLSLVPLVSISTSSTSVSLSWTAIQTATAYDVWYTTGSTRIFAATVSGLSYIITGLNPSTSYTFEVFAKNASGKIVATTGGSTQPTTPIARSWIGRNLTMQGSVNSIGVLTNAFAGGTTSACTTAQGFINKESWPIVSVRLLFCTANGIAPAIQSARVATMGTGTVIAPQFSWSQVTFSSANTWTPASGASYSGFNLNAIVSDEITLATKCPAGDTVVIWASQLGGSALNVNFPAENKSNYLPSLYRNGYFCSGDFASIGTSGTPTWLGQDLGGPVPLMLCTYDTGSGAVPLVNILAAGDSVWAGVPPIVSGSQTYGDHWCEVVNTTARTNNKKFRITSIGQGGDTMSNTNTRIASLNNVGFFSYCDKLIAQGWSWNNRNDTDDSTMQTALVSDKSIITISAGRAFGVGILSPMGQDDTADPTPTDFTTTQQNVYNGQASYISAGIVPNAYWNVNSSIWDPVDHLRHLSANSYDNVHCYIGANIGQSLQASAVYSAELINLTLQGYTV